MAAIEKDANERYERRQMNQKLAEELKTKGNTEYALSNFEKAIEYYTQVYQLLCLLTSIKGLPNEVILN